MESYYTGKEATKVRIIGIYQLAGGVIGLGLIAYLLSGLETFNEWVALLMVLAVALYAFSVYCGMLIIKKRPDALVRSRILQILQLFSFTIFGYTFMFCSGVYLQVGIDLTNLFEVALNAGLSSWQININAGGDRIFVAFNAVPIFLILFINDMLKKENREKMKLTFDKPEPDMTDGQ